MGGQNTYLDILIENSANDTSESSYNTFLSSVVLPPTGAVTVTGLPGGSQTVNLVPGVDPSTGQPNGVAVVNIPASTAAGALTVGISYAGDGNDATSSGSGTITIVAPTLLTSTITASMTGSISPTTSITVTGTVTGQSVTPRPPAISMSSPPAKALRLNSSSSQAPATPPPIAAS